MKDKLFDMYCFLEKHELRLTLKAVVFAQGKHKGQKRNNGNDYFEHPLAVLHILIIHNVIDDIILAASVLHDVIEDCGVTEEELELYFPYAVAHLVGLVSKEDGELAETVFGRIASDTRSVLIKLADRAHNLSEAIGVFGLERLEKYVEETDKHVLPMAESAAAASPHFRHAIIALSERVHDLSAAAGLYAAKKRDIKLIVGLHERLLEAWKIMQKRMIF